MHNFLNKIVQQKKEEVESLYSTVGYESLKEQALLLPKRRSFFKAISTPTLSLIAELKKASPSKGLINANFDPIPLGINYENNNATCISILTERHYFLGDIAYIKRVSKVVGIPILRKDFIIDPIQILESKCVNADCILLIKSLLSDEKCQSFLNLASENELDVIVEVHDEKELLSCLEMENIHIIGINNRNLKTFEVDLSTCDRLVSLIDESSKSVKVVAESGYSSIDELHHLNKLGVDAVLIGEGLVTNKQLLSYFNS
jgi:indole-3-glycerol phosphate synthase